MNIAQILSTLRSERDRINKAIAALEGLDGAEPSTQSRGATNSTKGFRKKKGGLTTAGRRRLSLNMKKRWGSGAASSDVMKRACRTYRVCDLSAAAIKTASTQPGCVPFPLKGDATCKPNSGTIRLSQIKFTIAMTATQSLANAAVTYPIWMPSRTNTSCFLCIPR